MPSKYDAIVIGSGHNGLTCACYLAKAGLKVLVLEKYHSIGGMTNTEELTLPGYQSDTHAICIQFANFSPTPDELRLDQYGYELLHPDPCWSHAFPDGRAIVVHRDLDRTCQSIARHSQTDADTWRRLYRSFLEQKDEICASFNNPPLSSAEQAARLTSLTGLEQYRFEMQSLRSWCDETFEAKETKCLAAAWGVHVGVSPDEAGGASAAWLFSMVIQHFGNNVVKGGMRRLPLALAHFLEAHGGKIRVNAQVKRILVENGEAVGVELLDGEQIRHRPANPVTPFSVQNNGGTVPSTPGPIVSNAHPRHLALDLLGEKQLGTSVASKMRRYELGESVMVIYLALDEPARCKAGREVEQSVYVHPSPPSLDYFSRIFSDARGGLLSAEPFALICNDAVADSSRVPPGKGLMKLVVQPVPFVIKGDAGGRIRGTNWKEVKEAFADRVIEQLNEQYLPDLHDRIVNRVVHSPHDIERLLPSAIEGTNSHGAFLPYQVGSMRPIPEMGDYRSPITNVYLCGSGSHPGPGVTMAPGRNAAQVIYRDLGLNFTETFCKADVQ